MASERLLGILARFRDSTESPPTPERLCQVSVDVVGASGAGIMVMSSASHGSTICCSNEVSSLIEELQFTLGEGPGLDAFHDGTPVLEPDLADPDAMRWPAFAPPAVAAGARAIFGFPLQVGAVCVGALNLYRDAPGSLDAEQQADAVVMAGFAARSVMTMQSDAPNGTLASAIEGGSQVRFVVHQASGMVSAQLSVTLREALIRLRGHAFANDRLVTDVAKDVVARRLRFDEIRAD
jgi:hypothetical protein